MTDTSPAIAAATLDHSERIRLLTEAVEKQRRTITKMSFALTVLIVLGLQGWISGLLRGETSLSASSLILQSKGKKTAFLSTTEDGLAVVLKGDNNSMTGVTLSTDGDALALVKEGKVLWKSQ